MLEGNAGGGVARADESGGTVATRGTPVSVKRLMIPLDGSRLAECVIPLGESLAVHLRAQVTLLHVMERAARPQVHGDRHLTLVPEANQYLAEVASSFRREHVEVDCHVHPNEEGDVAKSIVDHAVDLGADLIVLSTHGSGGARRVLFGSVAQLVLRKGSLPVLLVRPPDGSSPPQAVPTEIRRLLLPLDGNTAAESALPLATALAHAYGAEVLAYRVVPTLATISGDRTGPARLTPSATAATLELEEREAQAYVRRIAAQLQAAGPRASGSVGRGDPAQGVLEIAERCGVEMIIMATHGRTGLDAALTGSVASRVVAKFPRPIVLVRAAHTD